MFKIVDTLTSEFHQVTFVEDAREMILYILDGEELSDLQEEDRDALLLKIEEDDFEWAREPHLGLEVLRYG